MENKTLCIRLGRRKTYYSCRKIAREYLDAKDAVVKSEGTVPDGNIVEVVGETCADRQIINGKINGVLKITCVETGKPLLVENYKSGVLHGPRVEYYDNGAVFTEENYIEGARSGIAKEYYPDGALRFEDVYENGALITRRDFSGSSTAPRKEIEPAPAEETMQIFTKFTKYSDQETPVSAVNSVAETSAPFSAKLEEIIRKTANDCRVYYRNGEVVAKEILNRNGAIVDNIGAIPDSAVKEYYSNGQLKSEEEYRNGKLNGVRRKYDEIGRLWAEESYQNGLLDGFVRVHNYFKDKIFEEEAFFKNNKLHGLRKTFYPNGRVSVEENYKEGKFEGKRISYHENGQVNSEEIYKNGKLDGIRKKFFDNGQLCSEETYSEGKLEGVRKDYYMSGNVRFEENYSAGKLNGKRRFFFDTGKIMCEEIYADGKLKERNDFKNIKSFNL